MLSSATDAVPDFSDRPESPLEEDISLFDNVDVMMPSVPSVYFAIRSLTFFVSMCVHACVWVHERECL
jgi:hypothetical protein